MIDQFARRCAAALACLTLLIGAGCASGTDKNQPADLGPNAALIGVRLAWSAKMGEIDFPLDVKVTGTTVVLVDAGGTLAAIDARTGADLWRAAIGAPVVAGAGSDGRFTAVVTRDNELVVLEAGREAWRQKLGAQAFTAPLVAGARVFVLTADRAVSAFDAQSGRRLWLQARAGDPLVLRQAGLMLAVGDTLVVGQAGRMVGMNPLNGAIRWEVPVASPRGTNEVERLVDMVATVRRSGDVVCARAFQSNVGCVNAARGSLLWSKPANGFQGVHGDAGFVYGTEADGRVMAWKVADGERAWVSERLKYRVLTAPLAVGRSIAIGDSTGLVHFLSTTDAAPLNRVSTDGSAIAAAPVLAGDTLVVVTRNGGVFGFKPE